MKLIERALENITSKNVTSYITQLMAHMPDYLMERCSIRSVKPGSYLVQSGDTCRTVYILISGVVKIFYEMKNGIIYSFDKLEPPQLLGETESFSQFPYYRATVVCDTACKFIAIRKSDFLDWMKVDNEALYMLTVNITKKITKQTARDRSFLYYSGINKLAFQLSQYYEESSSNDICILKIPRYQLADETCMSIKTVNRCISKLKENGLITQNSRFISIDKKQYNALIRFLNDTLSL